MKCRKVLSRWCIVIAVTFLFVTLTLVPSAHAKKPTYIIKLGTLAPDGVGWATLIRDIICPGVLKVSDGEVALDWYYGGVMGDDEDYVAKMRNDQLQGAGFSGQGMTLACPEMTLMELPFLFNDYDEVEYFIDKMRDRIAKSYESRGYHLLLLAEQDFDQLYSTKYPLRTADDFKKSRFLTWYGPLEDAMLRRLGAAPIPINVPEVASSVRSGVCDAFISPAIWAVGAQMYTVMKYINPIRIRYSPAAGILTIKAWNRLPEKQRKAIDAFCQGTEKEFRQKVRESNVRCLKSMIKYGLKEVKMTPAELDDFKRRLIPIWDEFAANGTYPKSLLDETRKLLADFRAKKRH